MLIPALRLLHDCPGPAACVRGCGVTAPEKQYDDYAGVDVKGKILVMFGTVGWHIARANSSAYGLRNKARVALTRVLSV
jgi:hypothetical protein